jgi:chemotaxis protein methyltransferase CheR
MTEKLEKSMLDYSTFKTLAGELTGLDLSNYKSVQMDRRINSLKQLWNLPTYDDYLKVLKSDPKKYKEFVNRLTINVSEFFRNPERYDDLWNRILPEILSGNNDVKIWSAGCSNGAEPYSVAIIINELNAANRVRILATDFDREILNKAQLQPKYAANEVRYFPLDLLRKYFDIQEDYFYLKDSIRRMVKFSFHNLLENSFETGFDLIICRNVVIYFTVDAKNNLYQRFYEALKPGGYLWVGGTEPLLNFRIWGFENPLSFFYRKPKYP